MASEMSAYGPTYCSTDGVSMSESSAVQENSNNGCDQDLQAEYQSLQAQEKATSDQLEQLDLKVKHLQQSNIQLQDKYRAACQDNQALIKEISDIENSNKDLYEKSLCHEASVNKYCQLGQLLKEKLDCENEKIFELEQYIKKCADENALQLQDQQQQVDAALAEKKELKENILLLKEKLERLQQEDQGNQDEYTKVQTQIVENEYELEELNDEVAKLSAQLSQLKCELEISSQEYQTLQKDHCQIKDSMLQQEEERQKAFEIFFAQQSQQMKLEEKIKTLTGRKEKLTEENVKANALSENLQRQILAKDDKIDELDFKISEVATKQTCVSKKIHKTEKLIKHLIANEGKTGC